MNYKEMVKIAYEDIIDSFEKEATTLKSPVGPAIKEHSALLGNRVKLTEHANNLAHRMEATSPYKTEYQTLKKQRETTLAAHKATGTKMFNLENTPQYQQQIQNLHRFDNSVVIPPKRNMALGGKVGAMRQG